MENPQGTLNEFLRVFSKLKLDEMMAFFADARAGRKRIRLEAEDVHVKEFDGVAVVTFHIRNGELSRRTFVLKSSQGRWLIEDLHASNEPMLEEP
jgi:hypothetical protein